MVKNTTRTVDGGERHGEGPDRASTFRRSSASRWAPGSAATARRQGPAGRAASGGSGGTRGSRWERRLGSAAAAPAAAARSRHPPESAREPPAPRAMAGSASGETASDATLRRRATRTGRVTRSPTPSPSSIARPSGCARRSTASASLCRPSRPCPRRRRRRPRRGPPSPRLPRRTGSGGRPRSARAAEALADDLMRHPGHPALRRDAAGGARVVGAATAADDVADRARPARARVRPADDRRDHRPLPSTSAARAASRRAPRLGAAMSATVRA